jgi:16S rRNA (guanine527-N7)-methyltransferase
MRPDPGPHARLDQQLAALAPELGLTLSDDDRARLLGYMALIERWTKVYNLTAVRGPAEMFTHHLLDCLAVARPLELGSAGQPAPLHVLDVGSGAGLPGVVLAILRPDWQVTCVDAVAKKVTFIRQAAAELGLQNVRAVHGRVEAPETFGAQRFGLITSRAFASLADFTQLTRQLLTPTGVWAAMKAKLLDQEREELSDDISMFHVEQIQVPHLDAKRCLVWLRPADRVPETGAQPRQ